MSSNPSTETYEITIEISEADIDQLNHVNNTVYLRWVQEAAVAHWYSSATKEEAEKYIWVVVRHEIDYKYPARLGDKIIVRTRVGTHNKNIFDRHTDIFRSENMKLLAQAVTKWCPFDSKSMRPLRAGEEVIKRWSVSGPNVF